MRQDLLKKMDEKIAELKGILAETDTEDIVGSIASSFVFADRNLHQETGLTSPARQFLYLYGLTLSTQQNKNSGIMQKEKWERIKKLLEEIAMQYAWMFFPTEEEFKKGLSEEWKEKREVCMLVFLEYFNTMLLCYEEQIITRLNRWFSPFSDVIKQKIGCSLADLINFYQFVNDYINKYFCEMQECAKQERKVRLEFLDECQRENLSLLQMREKAQNHPVKDSTLGYLAKVQKMYHINVKDIYEKFGEKLSDCLLNVFVCKRQERDFRYYTERNPVANTPLYWINEREVFCTHPRFFLNSVYQIAYECLEQSGDRDSFLQKRDTECEKETLEILKSLFVEGGTFLFNVCENSNGTYEHDLVVLYKNNLFIIEVKAGKIREPLRAPDRAFQRIRDDFKRDNSIQKAYEQALHLKQQLLGNDILSLYDKDGRKVFEIKKPDIENIYLVCVTAENFGMIASDLSLLLEKPDSEPFPWCCNLFDLATLVEGFIHERLQPEAFMHYLDKRSELHAKIVSDDELDIAGWFIMYKTFKDLENAKADKIFIDPTSSEIFDKIYYEKRGIKYDMKIDERPTVVNVRDEIMKMLSENKKDEKNEE